MPQEEEEISYRNLEQRMKITLDVTKIETSRKFTNMVRFISIKIKM